MLNAFRVRSNCEIEAKFIQERIIFVERQISELCNVFGQYSRKAARLRDKGDELAKIALHYAETETINRSLTLALENFADSITTISDYGDVRVQMIDNKVVNEFSRYEDICKHVKEDVRTIYIAREKEINRKQQLERIRQRHPRSRQQIVQAETELVKATAEVSKTVHGIEDKTTTFERQKLHDIKSIFLDFISIEIGFHSKVLEQLTKAYKEIDSIDEESDLEELKKSLRVSDRHSEDLPKSGLFRTAQSLGNLFMGSQSKRSPGIPKQRASYSKSDETLDSMKRSISESEETISEISDQISNKTSEEEDDKSSPIIVRKFQK